MIGTNKLVFILHLLPNKPFVDVHIAAHFSTYIYCGHLVLSNVLHVCLPPYLVRFIERLRIERLCVERVTVILY